jgi:transcriptional regulator with XRE-family HTH domain
VAAKTLYRDENRIFAELLRDLRKRAGLTQVQITEQLGMAQTFASEAERGIRRLDIVQVRDWCTVCQTTLPALVKEFERRLVDPAFKQARESDGRRRQN